IGHVVGPTATLLDELRGEVAVGRVADREALADRVRLADRLVPFAAGLDAIADRVATSRLRAVHLRRHRLIDEAGRVEFGERFVNLANQSAAGHRADDVLREAPAEVFGDLEAEGLRAFGVERPEVDVHESPAVLERDLRAN